VQSESQEKDEQFYKSTKFIMIITACFFIYFCFSKSNQKYRFLSFSKIFMLIFLLIVTFIFFCSKMFNETGINLHNFDLLPPNFNWQYAITCVPIFFMVYSSHPSFFKYYKRLRNSSDKKISLSNVYGNLMTFAIYFLIAFISYLPLGEDIEKDYGNIVFYITPQITYNYWVALTILAILAICLIITLPWSIFDCTYGIFRVLCVIEKYREYKNLIK